MAREKWMYPDMICEDCNGTGAVFRKGPLLSKRLKIWWSSPWTGVWPGLWWHFRGWNYRILPICPLPISEWAARERIRMRVKAQLQKEGRWW